MRLSHALVAAALSLASFAPSAVSTVLAADDDAGKTRPNANVLVKITVGKIEGGNRRPMRTYHLVAPGSGTAANLTTANRIPFPMLTTAAPSDDGHTVPMSSFTYQSIGFQAHVRTWILPGDQVRIAAEIEDTSLYNPSDIDRKPGSATAPVVTTFSQSIDAVLREGAPLTTTVVDDPKGQSMYIQVGAEIQK